VDEGGRLWSAELGLFLVRWEGEYDAEHRLWLRWAGRDGLLLPTTGELAVQERERAEHEREKSAAADRRAAQAESRADAERARTEDALRRLEELSARLRELGVDPAGVAGGD
jgi:hypothetical protein